MDGEGDKIFGVNILVDAISCATIAASHGYPNWYKLKCPAGTKGKTIEIHSPVGAGLYFCGLRVYGF